MPFQGCKGSGEMEKPISLREFADLLDHAILMEPDYAELAKQKPISQHQDSREAAGIGPVEGKRFATLALENHPSQVQRTPTSCKILIMYHLFSALVAQE